MDFWEKEFGNLEEAEDFAGRKIRKNAHGQNNSQYGWDIDHIQPLAKNGTDTDNNKQIVHIDTNDDKGDRTTFSIGNKTYQVQRKSKSDKACWANKYDYSNKKYCIVEIEQ